MENNSCEDSLLCGYKAKAIHDVGRDDITIEFSCFGRGNFMTPPEAGTLWLTVAPCRGAFARKPYAQSQLQRNVMFALILTDLAE